MMSNAVLTDDDRFLLIYNFNPAQSVTVVDTKTRKFVREVETPGCALEYPTGPRSFFTVCGDGSLLLVSLDDNGAAQQKRTEPLLGMGEDPVTEKAVRIGRTWYFVTFDGRIFPLEADAKGASVGPIWWLTSEAERKAGWRPGGLQQLAVNPNDSRLYAIMHRGGIETHKDPGKDVWVFDVPTPAARAADRAQEPGELDPALERSSTRCSTASSSTAPTSTSTTRRAASCCARSSTSARRPRSWSHLDVARSGIRLSDRRRHRAAVRGRRVPQAAQPRVIHRSVRGLSCAARMRGRGAWHGSFQASSSRSRRLCPGRPPAAARCPQPWDC